MENSDGTSRGYFDANVSAHDLVQFYWPAVSAARRGCNGDAPASCRFLRRNLCACVQFHACVQRAHAGSIMCSYNAVNGGQCTLSRVGVGAAGS